MSQRDRRAPDEAGDVDRPADAIEHLLAQTRRELGLDVVFVGEFTGGARIYRHVDGKVVDYGIASGLGDPLEETYCQRVVDGRIPAVVPDARAHEATAELDLTRRLGIGCHVGVPIKLSSGRVYGTLCGFGRSTRPDLVEQDRRFLRVMASMVALQLEREESEREARRVVEARVAPLLEGRHLSVVVQPIVDLRTGGSVGVEALSRIDIEPFRPPDAWFEDAWSVGLGTDLELVAVDAAAQLMAGLLEPLYLAVNVSPSTLLEPAFRRAVHGLPHRRLVVEITEHMAMENLQEVQRALEWVLDLGVRLAIDDVGAGFSGLSRILELSPDIIKLDHTLTENIHADAARRALASALVKFAAEVDAVIVAEGIEMQEELDVLRQLGVTHGQGFFLRRPGPPESLQLTTPRFP